MEAAFSDLKLVLNSDKPKDMLFSRLVSRPAVANVFSPDGKCIQQVSSYKYLGVWLDEKLTFKIYINNLVKKLKIKLGFYLLKTRFNFAAWVGLTSLSHCRWLHWHICNSLAILISAPRTCSFLRSLVHQ